jgi:hypothetical protein
MQAVEAVGNIHFAHVGGSMLQISVMDNLLQQAL